MLHDDRLDTLSNFIQRYIYSDLLTKNPWYFVAQLPRDVRGSLLRSLVRSFVRSLKDSTRRNPSVRVRLYGLSSSKSA